MAYASSSDVEARLGRDLTTEESTLVTTRLDDVERLINRVLARRGLSDLATRIADSLTAAEDATQVEADVVLRLVRNPDGYASETDGTYAYTFNKDLASGLLEIMPGDWETLGVHDGPGLAVLVPTVREPLVCR